MCANIIRMVGQVFVAAVKVAPRHCDAQAMVHALRYYEFFEDAFVSWFDERAGGYGALRSQGVDVVIVQSGCRYLRSARLGDELAITVESTEVSKRSFTITFTVDLGTESLAVGTITYVAVRDDAATTLPPTLRAALAG